MSTEASSPPEYDIFLAYTARDRAVVEQVARRLEQAGLHPFFDRWALTPGQPWQEELAHALRLSGACAVFVGTEGLGDWAREELAVAQDRAARNRRFRLFMVLLEGAPEVDDPRLAFLSTRTWVDLRAGLADADAFDELLAAVTGTPRRRTKSAAGPASCPYRGLARFGEEDADLFFGREVDIRRLVERLRTARFLAVLGPSGSGKSSLVQAGLVPALRRGALPGGDRWIVRRLAPGGRPLGTLAAELTRLLPGEGMQQTMAQLASDERTLDLAVTLAVAGESGDAKLLLVVDQLEEIFTLCSDEPERAAFFDNLVYAATIPGGRTVIVAAMRADFYHRCAGYPRLAALVAAQQFLVGPLDRDGLRRAIEEPAWRAGLELEPGLVEKLIEDVESQPGALPLLQHVLVELWARRRDRLLTLGAYAASGGVKGALGQRADEVYDGLTPAHRETARRVLTRLVQPGQGTVATRRRVTMTGLATGADTPDDVQAVVSALVDSRLLTAGHDATSNVATVEITHEALVNGWPQLRAWIDRDREQLLAERRLEDDAGDWSSHGRPDDRLYRAARLAAWDDSDPHGLGPLEREFLETARAQTERERIRRRRRLQLTFAVLLLLLAAISAAAFVARREANRARSRALAAEATLELAAHPPESLRLALRAYDTDGSAEAETVLRQATLEYRGVAGASAHERNANAVAVSPDGRQIASGGDDGVRLWKWGSNERPLSLLDTKTNAVAFTRDGRRLAAAGADGRIRLWDVSSRVALPSLGRAAGAVYGLAFSPDGRWLASADALGGVRLWSLAEPGGVRRLRGNGGTAFAVAYSLDGRLLAAAGRGGAVRVWHVRHDRPPVVLRAGRDRVWAVALSRNGRELVAGGVDGWVRLWTLGRDVPPRVLKPGSDGVHGVTFTRAGGVAAASEEGTVRLWDRAGRLLTELNGPEGRTVAVAVGPDDRLLSAGEDGIVWVWQPAADVVLSAEPDPSLNSRPFLSVAVSPDGERVAGARASGTIDVWRPEQSPDRPLVLGAVPASLTSIAFDSAGARVVTGDTHGNVRLWDAGHRTKGRLLLHEAGEIWSAAFTPDDRYVVSAGEDGTVRLSAVAAPRRSVVVSRHTAPATSVAVSRDGRWIASSGEDQRIRIASVSSPHRSRVVGHYGRDISSVAFSPDGRRLVTACVDGKVWIGTTERPFGTVLRGHDGVVYRAVFAPDGQTVVSVGSDRTVRVWDPNTKRAVVLRGHTSDISGLAVSSDGRSIVSGSADGTVRMWRCDVCGPIADVVALARQRWLP